MMSPRTLRHPGAVPLFAALTLVFLLASRAPAGPTPGTISPDQFTWTRAFDGGGTGNNSDSFHSVVMDPQGDIVVGGSITDASNNQLFAVTKVDPTGTTVLWQQTLSGDQTAQNECRSVAIDASGNIAATGTVRNMAGGLDLVVMKWGPAGNPIWSSPQIYPGEPASDDAGDAVRFDSVGNVIVCGYSTTSDTGSDFLVAKFAGSDGTLVWSYAFDGGSFTGEEAFAVTTVPGLADGTNPQDDVVAVGTLAGSQIIYAVRLDGGSVGPSTTEVWTRTILMDMQASQGVAYTVAADGKSNIILGGIIGSANDTDFFITKLSGKDGTDAWASPIGIDGGVGGPDGVSQLVLDANGDILAAGQLTDAAGGHFTVAKLRGADGGAVWRQTLDGTSTQADSRALSIATDKSGSSIAAGYVTNSTTGKTFVTAKWDLNGNQLWARQTSGSLGQNDTASAVAVDSNGNVAAAGVLYNNTTGADGAIGYVDQQPPDISSAFLDTTTLPSSGGKSNLFAKVHDNIAVQSVTARIINPDATTTLVSVPPAGGTANQDDYSVALSFPPNGTSASQVYQVFLDTADTTGNRQKPASLGTVTVSGSDTTPPVITNPRVSPSTLSPSGGAVSIFADVSDNVAVGSVTAKVTGPGGNVTSLPMSLTSGSTYRAVFNAPSNLGPQDLTYTVQILATDTGNNTATASAGAFTVQANDVIPPNISNCVLSPSTLPQAGGAVTISADVTDNRGVATVTARISRPDSSQVDVALSRVQQGQSTFRGTFAAPSNGTQSAQQYTVVIVATDISSNSSKLNCGTITVAGPPVDTTPPALSACDVSPRSLTYTGGPVQLTVTATDDVQVASVTARITGPGGIFSDVNLSRVSGNVYQGTFTAPPNRTPSAQSYAVEYRAVDTGGNAAALSCDSFTVGVDTDPPAYANLSVTPQTLPGTGGAIVITADVSDVSGVAAVLGVVVFPDNSVHTVPLTHLSGSTYQGSFTIPANGTAEEQVYLVGVSASDLLGNTGSQLIAGVSEGVVASGKLAVSTDHIDFGKVKYGTRIHGHVTVRNTSQTGQPLIVTVDPLFDPFGVSGSTGPSLGASARSRAAQGPFTVTLSPGQSAVLDVSFGPRITRGYADRLLIHSSDPKKQNVTVRVKGIGCRNGRPGSPIGDGGG